MIIQANADAPATVQSRTDAYAATELTVAGLAQNSPELEQVKPFTDPVVDGKPVRNFGGFSFSLDDKDFRDAFNAALVEFRKSDAYKTILTGYGLSEESIKAAMDRKVDDLCAGK